MIDSDCYKSSGLIGLYIQQITNFHNSGITALDLTYILTSKFEFVKTMFEHSAEIMHHNVHCTLWIIPLFVTPSIAWPTNQICTLPSCVLC